MKTGKIIAAIAAAFIMVATAACGSKSAGSEAVATKITEGAELTQDDYGSIIDYCGEYAKEAKKYYDIFNQTDDNTTEAAKATSDLVTLRSEYKYIDLFSNTLQNVEMSALDQENQDKVKDLATKYPESFPLPMGAGPALQQPGVAGDIEQMPSQTDTDTSGVISEGAGVAVDSAK